MPDEYEHFHEVQYFRTWWYLLLTLIPTGVVWWGAIQQLLLDVPWGNNPGPDGFLWFLLVVIGVLLPAFMLSINMRTTVTDTVNIFYFPLINKPKRIFKEEIVTYAVVRYSPISEYGGWGIKGTSGHRAYNVSGNRGVRITYANGNTVLIGSQKPELLYTAITAMIKTGSARLKA
ncbi:MAG TPA: DUF6141 family protein [Methanomassiliicoccales archaeon]|nr:DUF6141 family protein [Methanomassiliicoccales archaeon]HPR98918.1 DUF6141 family protein [Methanomassiliicoccales archaeon]